MSTRERVSLTLQRADAQRVAWRQLGRAPRLRIVCDNAQGLCTSLLQAGDVLDAINGTSVSGQRMEDVLRHMAIDSNDGPTIQLTVVRGRASKANGADTSASSATHSSTDAAVSRQRLPSSSSNGASSSLPASSAREFRRAERRANRVICSKGVATSVDGPFVGKQHSLEVHQAEAGTGVNAVAETVAGTAEPVVRGTPSSPWASNTAIPTILAAREDPSAGDVNVDDGVRRDGPDYDGWGSVAAGAAAHEARKARRCAEPGYSTKSQAARQQTSSERHSAQYTDAQHMLPLHPRQRRSDSGTPMISSNVPPVNDAGGGGIGVVIGKLASGADGAVTKRHGFRASVAVNSGTIYSGYLEKQSAMGTWQSRYFEVAGHYLKYYADEHHRAELQASIDIMKVSLPDPSLHAAGERTLEMGRPNGTVIRLRAPTEGKCYEWKQRLIGVQRALLASWRTTNGETSGRASAAEADDANFDADGHKYQDGLDAMGAVLGDRIASARARVASGASEIGDSVTNSLNATTARARANIGAARARVTAGLETASSRVRVGLTAASKTVAGTVHRAGESLGKLTAADDDAVTKRYGFRPSVLVNEGAIYSGYLEKQSAMGTWQSRYFEVAGHYLKYYADEHHRAELQASIDIMKVSLPDPSLHAAGERTLEMGRPNGTVIRLRAPTEGKCYEWKQRLIGVQQAARPTVTVVQPSPPSTSSAGSSSASSTSSGSSTTSSPGSSPLPSLPHTSLPSRVDPKRAGGSSVDDNANNNAEGGASPSNNVVPRPKSKRMSKSIAKSKSKSKSKQKSKSTLKSKPKLEPRPNPRSSSADLSKDVRQASPHSHSKSKQDCGAHVRHKVSQFMAPITEDSEDTETDDDGMSDSHDSLDFKTRQIEDNQHNPRDNSATGEASVVQSVSRDDSRCQIRRARRGSTSTNRSQLVLLSTARWLRLVAINAVAKLTEVEANARANAAKATRRAQRSRKRLQMQARESQAVLEQELVEAVEALEAAEVAKAAEAKARRSAEESARAARSAAAEAHANYAERKASAAARDVPRTAARNAALDAQSAVRSTADVAHIVQALSDAEARAATAAEKLADAEMMTRREVAAREDSERAVIAVQRARDRALADAQQLEARFERERQARVEAERQETDAMEARLMSSRALSQARVDAEERQAQCHRAESRAARLERESADAERELTKFKERVQQQDAEIAQLAVHVGSIAEQLKHEAAGRHAAQQRVQQLTAALGHAHDRIARLQQQHYQQQKGKQEQQQRVEKQRPVQPPKPPSATVSSYATPNSPFASHVAPITSVKSPNPCASPPLTSLSGADLSPSSFFAAAKQTISMHNTDRPCAQNTMGASSGAHMPAGSSLVESLRQMQHEVSALKALGVALPASSATT